jgi:hypothetical protein
MTNPAAEQKAIAIVDAFMDTSFEEQADAAAWLVKRIAAAIDEAERRAREAYYAGNDNQRSGGP